MRISVPAKLPSRENTWCTSIGIFAHEDPVRAVADRIERLSPDWIQAMHGGTITGDALHYFNTGLRKHDFAYRGMLLGRELAAAEETAAADRCTAGLDRASARPSTAAPPRTARCPAAGDRGGLAVELGRGAFERNAAGVVARAADPVDLGGRQHHLLVRPPVNAHGGRPGGWALRGEVSSDIVLFSPLPD